MDILLEQHLDYIGAAANLWINEMIRLTNIQTCVANTAASGRITISLLDNGRFLPQQR